jgi:hypothetical protein
MRLRDEVVCAAVEGEIQGSLRCATDGEAVRRSGRDDVLLLLGSASVDVLLLLLRPLSWRFEQNADFLRE